MRRPKLTDTRSLQNSMAIHKLKFSGNLMATKVPISAGSFSRMLGTSGKSLSTADSTSAQIHESAA